MTLQPGQAEARLCIAGSAATVEDACADGSLGALRLSADAMCARAACAAVQGYGGDAYAKSMLGVGPLAAMDDAELAHWQRVLHLLLQSAAKVSLLRLCAEAEVQARRSTASATRRAESPVACTRDIAPTTDAASVRGRLERAVEALQDGRLTHAVSLLRDTAAGEEAALASAINKNELPLHAMLLTLAHFWDRAADHSAVRELCSSVLREAIAAHPSDSGVSSPIVGTLCTVMELVGEKHPLVELIASMLTRPTPPRAPEEEAEEEWPDELARRTARIAEAQASLPVPERVHAMRSAAATLAITGAPEQAGLLVEQALAVLHTWLDCAADDPRLLGTLLDLHACRRAAGADTSSVAEQVVDICSTVAETLVASGQTVQAGILLRSAASEFGEAPSAADAGSRGRALSDQPGSAECVRDLGAQHEPQRGRLFFSQEERP